MAFGEMLRVPAGVGEQVQVEIAPVRGVDVGAGSSARLRRSCPGGEVGIVIDARGRPLDGAEEAHNRSELRQWLRALDVYPREV